MMTSYSNSNSTTAYAFDLIAFDSSAFLTLTYELPLPAQAHSYVTALTDQFQDTLVDSGLAKAYRLVDDISNSLQGGKAMLTFRLLNVDGGSDFFTMALTQYQRAISAGKFDVVFNSQTMTASKVQLTSSVETFTTPSPPDSTDKSTGKSNNKATAAVVAVVVVATLIVAVVVILSRRKMKRFEQVYDRLQRESMCSVLECSFCCVQSGSSILNYVSCNNVRCVDDVMAPDEDDEAMLMTDNDDDTMQVQGGPTVSLDQSLALHLLVPSALNIACF
jgi:hypothetical protein